MKLNEKQTHALEEIYRVARMYAQEIERAIDEIIKYDFQNIYKKVKQ